MVARKSSRRTCQRRDNGSSTAPHAWSDDEDDTLRDGVARLGPKRWRAIAAECFAGIGRTADACYARWVELTLRGQSAEKHKWSAQEDRRLTELATLYHQENWSLVASELRGRNAKQCRERWQNQLRPDLKRDAWTREEDAVIVASQAQIGNKWANIARKLPGRTDNMVKNRWYSTLSREALTPAKPAAKAKSKVDAANVEPHREPPAAGRVVKPKAKRKRQKLFGTTTRKKKKQRRTQKPPVESLAQSPDSVDAVVDPENPGNPWMPAIPSFDDVDDGVEESLDGDDASTRFLLEMTDALMAPSQHQHPDEAEDWFPSDVGLAADPQYEPLDVNATDESDLLVGLEVSSEVAASGAWMVLL